MTATSVQVSTPKSAARRGSPALLTAVIATVAVAVGASAVLALHVVAPTSSISPLRRTISEYAYTDLGWVFNAGVLTIAIGSALIAAALCGATAMRPSSAGAIAMLTWSVALVVLVIFPKHDWSVGPSSHGSIHRVASLVAFVSVPIAAFAIGRRRPSPTRAAGRVAMLFGILAGAWLAVLVGGFVVGPLTDTPWWQVYPLGLMERGMAFSAVAAVLALGWLAIRSAASQPVGGSRQLPQTVRRK